VVRHLDGELYALKRVKIDKLTPKEKENALNEVRFLASLKQKNIIGYKSAFIDENSQSL
jgi:NIMA (never in mitosis gene a)-related kinase